MSKKRGWKQPAVDTQLVEIYEDLANVDENIRLKAAHVLLTKFVSCGTTTGSQLNEILRRLIRGLCSGRKAARLGFSIALTEFLAELLGPKGKTVEGFVGISGLLETLKAQTHISGNVSGQEERDHQFGRLFGAESVIKSSILFQHNVDIEAWDQILDLIYELATRKPWLREECGFVLYTSLNILRDKDLIYSQLIIDKLNSNGLSKTSEGVAIWIAAQTENPSLKLPCGVWHREDPLDRKEHSRLAGIMNESPAVEPALEGSGRKVLQKGTWSSNMHFAWDVILTKLISVQPASPKEPKSKRISFVAFWERCVDENLFAASSSEERKYSGFELFQRMIANGPARVIPNLFTKNFMRCLKNQLASSERYLHRTAARAAKAMVARARKHPDLGPLFLKALLSDPNGDVNFDKITKTKTVQDVLSQIHDSDFQQLGNLYDELILRPGVQETKEVASSRLALAEQLTSLVRGLYPKPRLQDLEPPLQHKITRGILSLFAKYAYFNPEIIPNDQDNGSYPPISQASRQMFRSRISSCLLQLIAPPTQDPSLFPYSLICAIHDGETNPGFGALLLEADKGVVEVIRKAIETLGQVHSKAQDMRPGSQLDYSRSITLLYCLTLLQVYNEDPEAVAMLAELNDLFHAEIHSKGTRQQDSAALVEIMLGFVSKPSQLFRRLAQQVFTACAANLDGDGLQSMIKVLETKESLSGQAEIFDEDDEVDSMSDVSDVEVANKADVESTMSSAEDGSKDSDLDDTSDSSDHDSSGPDDELVAFDAKLAQALGTRPGNEDLNAEDSSSSDEDMDDEQMTALDEHLQKVFSEHKKVKSRKNEKKDAKDSIVNFKCRVLELLEIYVKQQHSNSQALSLLVPMLAAIRMTTSPLVSGKACSLMREFAKLCKGDGVPKVEDADNTFELFETVHKEAMREGSNAYANACSQASLLLVRALVAQDRERLRRIVRIYGNTQEKALFDSSCKIKTSFFTDWQNWCTSARK